MSGQPIAGRSQSLTVPTTSTVGCTTTSTISCQSIVRNATISTIASQFTGGGSTTSTISSQSTDIGSITSTTTNHLTVEGFTPSTIESQSNVGGSSTTSSGSIVGRLTTSTLSSQSTIEVSTTSTTLSQPSTGAARGQTTSTVPGPNVPSVAVPTVLTSTIPSTSMIGIPSISALQTYSTRIIPPTARSPMSSNTSVTFTTSTKPTLTTCRPATPTVPSKPLPILIDTAVKTADLQHPEYCFQVEVDFGKKLKDDPGVSEIKKITTGLLNTSGGFLEIMNHNGQKPDRTLLDKWKLNFEETLVTFIPYDVCRACIQLYDYSYPLKILVKKSPKLITLNSHLYVRWLAGNRVINDADCIQDVLGTLSGQPFPDPFQGKASIAYGSIVPVGEGPNVEFKCWNIQKKSAYISRLQDNRTQKTLFSLVNMQNGGFLIIGVEDEKNTVVGQVLGDEDQDGISKCLDDYLSSHSQRYPGGWGQGSRRLECGRDWTIKFLPVTGAPPGKPRSVIVIRFNHVPGGVCESCPESFLVSEAGYIQPMAFTQWREAFIRSRLQPQERPDPLDAQHALPKTNTASASHTTQGENLSPSPEVEVSSQLATSPKKNTFSKISKPKRKAQKHNDASGTGRHIVNQEGKPDNITGRTHMSWTQNRTNWESIVNPAATELEKDSVKLAESASCLKMTFPTNIFPSRDTIIAGQQCNAALLERALDRISSGTKVKSFGIASSKCIGNIQTDMELEKSKHHILDVFVMYETGRSKLWAILDEDASDVDEIWQFLFRTGRVTKRALLYSQVRCTRGFVSSVDLECCLFHLNDGPVACRSPISTTHIVKPVASSLGELKVCLIRVILEKETHIKSIFGDDRSIILTAEQMDVILSLGLDKFNFIEGPPGSGKTYVALRLCKQYNCGYIYANDTFGKFLEYQGVGHRFKASNSIMLQHHIDSDAFKGLQYVIVDDAHSLEFDESTWFSLFEYISAPDLKAKLVIFGDSSYQNFMNDIHEPVHRSRQYLLEFCRRSNYNPVVKTLSVIHRNHRKIAAFIKSNFEDDPNYPERSEIACSHSEDGDT